MQGCPGNATRCAVRRLVCGQSQLFHPGHAKQAKGAAAVLHGAGRFRHWAARFVAGVAVEQWRRLTQRRHWRIVHAAVSANAVGAR